jgi:hypothetical protein
MLRAIGSGVCVAAAATALCAAALLYYAYAKDAHRLKELALQLSAGAPRLDHKVHVLNTWVYRNQGFSKNKNYFLVASLGPTPVQVLEEGGDCSDKSRLLAAMLRQLGIKASLAMLYPCPGCVPVHTVVLAETESGTMVADPVYDLTFPKNTVGFHDVREMTRDPYVLTGRLAVLRAERGRGDKIVLYDEATHHYNLITTVNWRKYRWLKAASSGFRLFGLEPSLVHRPAILEDPKLLLFVVSSVAAALFAALAAVLRAVT